MAYKFQLGAAIMSGNLDQTGDVEASGELAGAELDIAGAEFLVNTAGKLTMTQVADLDGGIDVNSSNFTVSAAGAVTAASTLTAEGIVSGAAGTFDALAGTSLALQSGGITAAGAIAGASTISGSGAGSFGSLTLNGAANLQSAGITNAGSIAGATTIAASSTVTAEGTVSGAAGTFDALAGTSLALQGGGITAVGAIAGASTIDAGGKITGNEFATDGDEWQVSTEGAVQALNVTATGNIASTTGVLSGAAGLAGLGLTIAPGKTLGVIGDLDLLTLDADSLIVAGTTSTTGLTASAGAQLQGALEVAGNVFLPGADDHEFVVADDAMYFFDNGTGQMRRDAWSDVMTQAAGAGITATNGVLSADSAATPNGIGDHNVGLLEGFNYATASLSAARTYTLPSDPSAGDVVHIKLMGGVSATNYGAVTGSAADGFNKYKIDGRSEAIRLESVSGAVSLIWTGTQDVGWAIY